MSFPLPPEFKRAVLDRVRSGQYESPEAVLAAMLELLEDAEAEYDSKLEALRRDVQLGFDELDRGQRLSREEVLARLREARPGAFAETTDGEGSQTSLGAIAPEFRDFVNDEVRSGRYASSAEVLEAALWLLRDAESPESEEALEALRREIALGLESERRDPMIPGEEVEAWLRARVGGGAC